MYERILTEPGLLRIKDKFLTIVYNITHAENIPKLSKNIVYN